MKINDTQAPVCMSQLGAYKITVPGPHPQKVGFSSRYSEMPRKPAFDKHSR